VANEPWYRAGWLGIFDLVLDYLEDPSAYHDEPVDTEDGMP
jgi:hypothetical protein